MMTQRVVDILESVQVNIQQRQAAFAAADFVDAAAVCLAHREIKTRGEQHAVGQPGQEIVFG